ncbi:MAG: hypothetical protein EZS28_036988, partial [Streblomastix strix]
QITTIHIPEKLNSTIDSLSRLCRSGDYSLKDGMIQMICRTWNYMPQIDIFATQYNKLINNYATEDLNDLGTHFQNAFNYKWNKIKLYIHPPIPILSRVLQKMKQDKAQGITIAQIWPGQSQDPGDVKENERQGSKASTSQCGRLPSGPIADVGRDLLKRCMNMRGFSEDGVNLLFNGQRFNTVKRDFYYLALLQDLWNIERIAIEDMMKRDAEVILTENLASSTTSKLINKALANATIPHRRYQNIWNIQILFNQWRQSKQNKYLNNYDLQVKIASILMLICFFRPNQIAEIRLKFSNVNKTENQASLRLAPKQANAIETYEVYETDNEKLSPKLAIYEWIDRLKKQFPKGTDILLRHKGFNKPTTTKNISLQLTKLLRELKIVGASAYSIRHSASTELAKLGIPERDLATFTHHSQNSRTVQQYHIFASSIRANEIASQLTNNPGQDNERLNQVSQQRGEIRREGGNKLLSSSPSETRREFLRELKDRTSGMMLKVGWSAWNDIAEIRTLPCQMLISNYGFGIHQQKACTASSKESSWL